MHAQVRRRAAGLIFEPPALARLDCEDGGWGRNRSGLSAGAMVAGLERNIEQGSNRYMAEDGTVKLADPELRAIESDEALAKEIGECVLQVAA